MDNFLFAFFLKISVTSKAHISGTETDINKRPSSRFLTVFHNRQLKNDKKFRCIGTLTMLNGIMLINT